MNFDQVKKQKAQLEAESERTSCALNALSGGGSMGLTPGAVRSSPEWQTANREYALAFAALRAFNKIYMRRYKREFLEDRRQRRRARIEASP